MKLKKIIAALLCAAQIVGCGIAFAEEQVPAEETQTTETTEQTGEETEIPPEANELRVYMSADGDDKNDGTFKAPVKTIEKALGLASGLKKSNPGKTVAVTIRGGDYRLKKGVRLSANHSGTEGAPFVIQSYNGEEVNFLGSVAISPRLFKKVTDPEILARFPKETAKYVGEYDLSKVMGAMSPYQAKPNLGQDGIGYYELITDSKYQTLARFPNTGYDHINGIWDDAWTLTGSQNQSRISRWKQATNAVIAGYLGTEYSYATAPITSYEDNRLHLGARPYYGLQRNNRYWVENLMEEIDMPGEYYFDVNAKKLYYYPPYDIGSASIEITNMTDTMFYGEGIQYLTFKGIGFKNTRGKALELPDAKNIVIEDCTLANIGYRGIILTNSTNCTIKNSTMYHIGSSAIEISGGDLASLTPSGNLIDNNHIYDFASQARSNRAGINIINGVGMTITNNMIHSSPGQGVLYEGNEHTINYNEFYELVDGPSDAGAVYAGRDYTQRGTEVAYNYFHDIQPDGFEGGSIFVAGLYMDDMQSSVNAHHNIFYNCELGVMYGGGRDNQFNDNIMIDCKTAMFMDARGVGWASYHAAEGGQAYRTISQVPYNKEPWASRYPELLAVTEDLSRLGLPEGNTIKNNLLEGCGVNMIANEVKQYGDVDNNPLSATVDKSLFKDYDGRNFELKEGTDTAAKFKGAAEIDMSKIGLREDMQKKVAEKAQNESLKLIGPWNGEKDIINLGYTFSWDKNSGSDKYIVKIAEDPEMKNVVLTHESLDNIADIKFIPSGGKPYWWTVTGVSESQSLLGTEIQQTGAPRLFISALTEKTEKKELRDNIKVLKQLDTAVVEGEAPGTYKKGFKSMVQGLLTEMEAANVSSTVLQVEINALNEKYNELLDELINYINYEVVNVGDLLENQGAWEYADGMYTFNEDGSLTLQGEKGKINHYRNMYYAEDLGDNVAIKFGYKTTVSSNYCIIGLQNDASFLNGGYNMIIKSNQMEIQKRITGTTGDSIKSSVLNFYTKDGQWNDFEMGALKTGIGTYFYLICDGYMVDSFLDMEAPIWTGESHFVFGNPSGSSPECITSIRPAQD